MKLPSRLAFSLAGLFAVALSCAAQPAPRIAVVDLGRVYDGHFKTDAQNIKLRSDLKKAEEELDRINKEGAILIERYKEQAEQAKNLALSKDARARVEQEAAIRLDALQRKQAERDKFTATVDQRRQEQVKAFREQLLAEIINVANGIAKKRGATLLIDKSGPSLFGTPSIIYADQAYDITEELITEVNKDRPAAVEATPPGPSFVAPSAAPTITVPGAPAKK